MVTRLVRIRLSLRRRGRFFESKTEGFAIPAISQRFAWAQCESGVARSPRLASFASMLPTIAIGSAGKLTLR